MLEQEDLEKLGEEGIAVDEVLNRAPLRLEFLLDGTQEGCGRYC
jgi:hypothetical protein